MDYFGQFCQVLLLAVPMACLVWTFTQEEIFKEFRETLKMYQREHVDSWWRKKLAYVPTCPFCLSHYVAGLFVALFQFKMLTDDWRGYAVSLLSLVMVANVYLTAYNLLRAALRACKAVADRAEAAVGAPRLPATAEGRGTGTHPSRVRREGALNGRWKPAVDRHSLRAKL
jgi:hypothetical protein